MKQGVFFTRIEAVQAKAVEALRCCRSVLALLTENTLQEALDLPGDPTSGLRASGNCWESESKAHNPTSLQCLRGDLICNLCEGSH